MNQTRIVTIIILIVLTVAGWAVVLFTPDIEDSAEYKQHFKMAKEYHDRGLYQKSIKEYEQLLELKPCEENNKLLLESYECRYNEEESIYSDYVFALQSAITIYPTNVEYIEKLAQLYIEKSEYKSAYKLLSKAVEAGVDDEAILKLKLQVQYAFEMQWSSYSEVTCYNYGYCVAKTFEKWIYLGEDGSTTEFKEKDFASPVGENGVRVVSDGKRTEIIDTNMVVQGLLDFVPVACGNYCNNLAPIMRDDTYSYYDTLGDKKFGEYSMAGSFAEGKAAVCHDGKWHLIDTEGNAVSDKTYTDIKLNLNSSHLQEGIMIAKKDSQYMIYDSEENVINEFSCDDVDVCTSDGLIAYAVGDKWGFVDKKGEILISPQYRNAKSFSNGLAAVFNGDKWGFINSSGTLVIDYQFYDVSYFNSKGYCFVKVKVNEDKNDDENNYDWKLISLYIK